ncbi:hypothetical protein UCRPC4_g06020 [Phaeomoniella chlamydospora]|uniref:Uncharacterized protein n=1 Tax=Phaeomoniella chlamydospora TaxID=158046 RepID=A0A0G2DZR1_PHACM|nr:hypothetical protein UCRPC4_g06020 [Phaeomoniella chlamydospora]
MTQHVEEIENAEDPLDVISQRFSISDSAFQRERNRLGLNTSAKTHKALNYQQWQKCRELHALIQNSKETLGELQQEHDRTEAGLREIEEQYNSKQRRFKEYDEKILLKRKEHLKAVENARQKRKRAEEQASEGT